MGLLANNNTKIHEEERGFGWFSALGLAILLRCRHQVLVWMVSRSFASFIARLMLCRGKTYCIMPVKEKDVAVEVREWLHNAAHQCA